MATLDSFILLTATCRSTTIQRELTAAFSFRQWLSERATVLGYMYIAYLDCTLLTPSRLIHFMDPPPTLKIVAHVNYRVIIR